MSTKNIMNTNGNNTTFTFPRIPSARSLKFYGTGAVYGHGGTTYVDVYDDDTKTWVNIKALTGSPYLIQQFGTITFTKRPISGVRWRTSDHWHGTHSTMGITVDYQAAVVGGVNLTASIHKQDFSYSGQMSHEDGLQAQWKILVNGIQKYPASGYTTLTSVPFNFGKNLPHTDFNIGTNTVQIETRDSGGNIETFAYTMNKVNATPTVVAQLSAKVIHGQDIKLNTTFNDANTDDRVQYRVLLNNVQRFPSSGFSALENVPATLSIVFSNSELNVGTNTVRVEFKDDWGAAGTWTETITKLNAVPTLTGNMSGLTLNATINDTDGDDVRYRILINGIQVFPESNYTTLLNVPLEIKYTLSSHQVNIGSTNLIRVEYVDSIGSVGAWEKPFIADFAGLMFCDEAETYYSTDLGEILKYLDFGTIVAGQTSTAERVWLKNTLGYPVEEIQLWNTQGELDGVNAKAEISYSTAPFEAVDVLEFADQLNHGEKIPFYVRIVTNRFAAYGGMFDIYVKADPVL
jgi:hypothetical protein